MKAQFINAAAEASEQVYHNNISIKSTQFSLSMVIINGKTYQRLAIAGTNSFVDWLWNVWLVSTKGVKRTVYVSANRILKSSKFRDWWNPSISLIVTGHSKGGPVALEICRRGYSNFCVSFCPAPGFRRPTPELNNAIIITDADDIVPFAGAISFWHPKCEWLKISKNKKWWNLLGKIKDHPMASIIKELQIIFANSEAKK